MTMKGSAGWLALTRSSSSSPLMPSIRTSLMTTSRRLAFDELQRGGRVRGDLAGMTVERQRRRDRFAHVGIVVHDENARGRRLRSLVLQLARHGVAHRAVSFGRPGGLCRGRTLLESSPVLREDFRPATWGAAPSATRRRNCGATMRARPKEADSDCARAGSIDAPQRRMKTPSDLLRKLIGACMDDEFTLRHECKFVDARRAAALMRLAREREQFVADLVGLGHCERPHNGSWAELSREAQRDIGVAMAGPNDGDAVASCRHSRARTEALYDEVLKAPWPGRPPGEPSPGRCGASRRVGATPATGSHRHR